MTEDPNRAWELLTARYPALFNRKKSTGPFHYWGFECGAGWAGILDGLARGIAALVESGDARQPVVQQVKEKFGALRIYLHPSCEAVSKLVMAAEATSQTVCERCGRNGVLQTSADGWWATLCDGCRTRRAEGSQA